MPMSYRHILTAVGKNKYRDKGKYKIVIRGNLIKMLGESHQQF